MKTIIRFVAKYIVFALFIIVVLLYTSGMEITRQAIIMFGGVVIIDLLFSLVGGISLAIAKGQKKAKAKKNAKKAKEAGETVAAAVKDTGTVLKDAAESTWGAIKEKGESVSTVIKEKLNGGQSAE